MSVAEVRIRGLTINPSEVVADQIMITHGRTDVASPPTASVADLQLLTARMPTWRPGDLLEVLLPGNRPRFTGRVTDMRLTGHVDLAGGRRRAVIELTATGAVADAGRIFVGDAPWPAELATARATRILTEAGLPYQVMGVDDDTMLVRPADVDRRTALELLQELSASCSSAVYDRPDGTIVYQPYSVRATGNPYETWADQTTVWSAQTRVWSETAVIGPGAGQPLPIPGNAIVWEPEWATTSGDIINRVRVGYGTPPVTGRRAGEQTFVEFTDTESVARFGELYWYTGTELQDITSANERAGLILSAQAQPRWRSRGVEVICELLDETTYVAALDLECGGKVRVTGLPQPAPAIDTVAVVEGWSHLFYRDNAGAWHERLSMNLSDPLSSYAGVKWEGLNPIKTWQTISTIVTWAGAVTNLDVEGP